MSDETVLLAAEAMLLAEGLEIREKFNGWFTIVPVGFTGSIDYWRGARSKHDLALAALNELGLADAPKCSCDGAWAKVPCERCELDHARLVFEQKPK